VDPLTREVDELTRREGFSGVARVDHAGTLRFAAAYGFAHRALAIANTVDTQFAVASGSKGLTALAVVRLIDDGVLELTTRARELLGEDLPLVSDDVTVEHLLAHRSGIGDYLDEDTIADVNDYVLRVPVQDLATTESFLAVLDGHPPKFPAGTDFAYCNGGYIVLALLAERASGVPFHDLVQTHVCEPAGMANTAFLRSDELPARAALGYLERERPRTNVFHLPVRGNGDGGIYTTAGDVRRFWRALFDGRIVSLRLVAEMVRPRSDVAHESIPQLSMRYGLGFWLHASSSVVVLEGMDAGVSFRSAHDPVRDLTHTVISNTTDGAWPLTRFLDTALIDGPGADGPSKEKSGQ
jgi:CubicO group peptidase (beta-lactamase class C family)